MSYTYINLLTNYNKVQLLEVRYISTQTLDEFCSNVWSCQAFWFARHTGYIMCTTHGYMDKSEGTHTHWSLTSGLCLSYPFYEYFSFDIFIDFYSEVEFSNLGKIVWIFPLIYPLFCRILSRHTFMRLNNVKKTAQFANDGFPKPELPWVYGSVTQTHNVSESTWVRIKEM